MTIKSGPKATLRRHLLFALKSAVFLACFACAAGVGVFAGVWITQDTPDVFLLETYVPNTSTRVLDGGGKLVTVFAEEKRTPVPLADIPKAMIDAVIAVEDDRFFQHKGVDLQGIARAAWSNFKAGRVVQGGSTLTQQLAKLLFLQPERSYERKVKEALLAIQIEKNFTKEEILELYLNQVYFGHGRYGVEAASDYFFGKHAKDLTLEEAALLAGLPQRPNAYSPIRSPGAAKARRDHVLERLFETGRISRVRCDAAKATPVRLANRQPVSVPYPYFTEEVRRQLVRQYDEATVYAGGLEVETTLDRRLQESAERAVQEGLRSWDKQRGFKGIERNIKLVSPETEPEEYWDAEWDDPITPGRIVAGIVTEVGAQGARVRIGPYLAIANRKSTEWTGLTPARIFRRGDIAPFRVDSIDEGKETARVTLEQDPVIEGALVAIEIPSGEIKAIVGGYKWSRSEFNRASQALRQTGSAFKPVFYAAAMDRGWTAASTYIDEPTVFLFPITGDLYRPENYYRQFEGITTLREALEKSKNVVSVKLLNAVGYDEAISTARKMGIAAPLVPYPSLALGSAEITLLELTSAYTTFVNRGVHVAPGIVRTVRNRRGEKIWERTIEQETAVKPETAFQMVYTMMGVVQEGTAARARSLGRPLAGKTGTTDDYTDAWFIGFTPNLAVGVWIGYDTKKTIGKNQTGAVAALPIWMDFMEEALRDTPPESFIKPDSVEFHSVDRRTGRRAGPDCPPDVVFPEAFPKDRPPEPCGAADHVRLTLPYCLQRFPIDGRLNLVVERESQLFDRQACEGCGIRVSPDSRNILVLGGTETLMGYEVLPGDELASLNLPPGGEWDPDAVPDSGRTPPDAAPRDGDYVECAVLERVRIGPWKP